MKLIILLINIIILVVPVCCLQSTVFADSNDWAVEVIEYVKGSNCHTNYPGYTNAMVALGHAATTTSNGIVDVTFAAWKNTEIVSIGDGGHLTLKMGAKVFDYDDSLHPYGVDLIVYGNAFFVTIDWNNKYFEEWYQFAGEPAEIWLSQDSSNWFKTSDTNILADSFFPTQSIDIEGNPSDYFYPVNPALLTNDWTNLEDNHIPWSYTNTVIAYEGAAGGAPVNLSILEDEHGNPTNLIWIQFVKIIDTYNSVATEIDAVAAVRSLPEPFLVIGFQFSVFGLIFGLRLKRNVFSP